MKTGPALPHSSSSTQGLSWRLAYGKLNKCTRNELTKENAQSLETTLKPTQTKTQDTEMWKILNSFEGRIFSLQTGYLSKWLSDYLCDSLSNGQSRPGVGPGGDPTVSPYKLYLSLIR